MPRYIDADLEVKKINNVLSGVSDKKSVGYFALKEFRHMLETAHTADVVPKSEVFLASSDAIKMLIECHGYALTHDADIKEEVAREIFEEIEKWLATDGTLLIITAKKFAEIKNKYTEE